jgi:hypothetical protein
MGARPPPAVAGEAAGFAIPSLLSLNPLTVYLGLLSSETVRCTIALLEDVMQERK